MPLSEEHFSRDREGHIRSRIQYPNIETFISARDLARGGSGLHNDTLLTAEKFTQ